VRARTDGTCSGWGCSPWPPPPGWRGCWSPSGGGLSPRRRHRWPRSSSAPAAQGDRLAEAPAEPEAKAKAAEKPRRNKDAEASNREAEGDTPALLKKQLSRIPTLRQASRDDLDEARRAGAVAAAPSASPPTDAVERAQAPRAEAKKAESISEEAGLRARTSAAPAKVAAAPRAVAASPAASPPAAPPATSGVGLQKESAAGRVDVGSSSVGSSSVAGLVGSTGSAGAAGGVTADKSDGPFAQTGAGAKEAQRRVTDAPAKNAAGKVGSDWAAREARLAEVRRAVAAATGDARKALLFEQCRLEASLEQRAAVVGTCSQVAREFPDAGGPAGRRAGARLLRSASSA
jgi:hypothetical protein